MIKKTRKKYHIKNIELGSIIFASAVLLAIICGLFKLQESEVRIAYTILAILGIVTGIMNIRKSETDSFLLSILVLFFFWSSFVDILSKFSVELAKSISLMTPFIVTVMLSAALTICFKNLFLITKDY